MGFLQKKTMWGRRRAPQEQRGDFVEGVVDGVVCEGRAPAFGLAAGSGKFAVHVDEAPGASALVEVVDILGAEKETVAEAGLELGERDVGGVGHGSLRGSAARGVELPDQSGVAMESFGGADVLDAMAGPKAVGGAEGGETALGADAGAGEDKDAVGGRDGDRGH